MDYLEAAALLGQAILESGEYKQFKDAEKALLADPKAQQIIMEHKQLQDEMVEASRNDWSKEDLERVRDTLLAKQKELNEYEATKQYLKAKQGFELVKLKPDSRGVISELDFGEWIFIGSDTRVDLTQFLCYTI